MPSLERCTKIGKNTYAVQVKQQRRYYAVHHTRSSSCVEGRMNTITQRTCHGAVSHNRAVAVPLPSPICSPALPNHEPAHSQQASSALQVNPHTCSAKTGGAPSTATWGARQHVEGLTRLRRAQRGLELHRRGRSRARSSQPLASRLSAPPWDTQTPLRYPAPTAVNSVSGLMA